MHIPGAHAGGIFDDPAEFMRTYRQLVQEAATTPAALPGSAPAPEVEGLSRRMSGMHVGEAGDFAPRGTVPIGGSARMTPPAALVDDRYGFHSARYDLPQHYQHYPPPSPDAPSSPENAPSSPSASSSEASDDGPTLVARGSRGAIGQSMRAPSSAPLVDDRRSIHSARYDPPARHAPARADYHEPDAPRASDRWERDPAPKRSSGLFSRFAKGAKKFFGIGNSHKHSGGSARAPARHSLDSSMPTATMFRMDSTSPGRGVPHSVRDDGVDARATQQPAPPAQAHGAESPIVPSQSWPHWNFDPGTPLDDAAGPSSAHRFSGAAFDTSARPDAPHPSHAVGDASQHGAPVGRSRPPRAPSTRKPQPANVSTSPFPVAEEDTSLIAAFRETPTWQGVQGASRAGYGVPRVLGYLAGWLQATGRGTLSARVAHAMPEGDVNLAHQRLRDDIVACRHDPSWSKAAKRDFNNHMHAAVRDLLQAWSRGEVSAAMATSPVKTTKFGEFVDEFKASLRNRPTKPLSVTSAEKYALGVDAFDDWLAKQALGGLADYLPHRLEALLPLLSQYIASGEMSGPAASLTALGRFLQDKSKRQPPAQAAEPRYGMPPAHAAVGPSFSPLPEPSGGWPDFGLYSPAPSQEVAGPFHPPRRGDSAIFSGLESFTSLPATPHGHEEPEQSRREVTSARRDEVVDADSYRPRQRARRIDAAQAIDLESYEPSRPEQPRQSVSQRLSADPWLHDDDFEHYGEVVARAIRNEMGPAAYARFEQQIGIVDAVRARLLTGRHTSAETQAQVLSHFAAPVLFLPVNNATEEDRGDHWSLLVVNRAARLAFHYDSSVNPAALGDPAFLQRLVSGRQYDVARQLTAIVLGEDAAPPMAAPMAQQDNGWSCGDHVLTGIEVLARRMVSSQGAVDMNLSGIQPSRQHIVQALSQYEADNVRSDAAPATQQRRGQAAPSARFGSTSKAAGPSRTLQELGHIVGRDWIHGAQPAADWLVNALGNMGLLPTPYRPQIPVQIHGQPYVAYLAQGGAHGTVWLAPAAP